MWLDLDYLLLASAMAFGITFYALPKFLPMFIEAGLFGVDMSKPKAKKAKVPEAVGVITGCIFLIVTILMIPLAFSPYFGQAKADFPHAQFVQLISALLSISCMLLLGFADDVLNLRWRHKLLLPSLASLPLLIVYYITTDRTDIVVPVILRPLLGTNIDLGFLYYVYMGMLAVFCTNAINILAGINGIEVGQSIVIASSIVVFNLKELYGPLGDYHRFSLYFLVPYLGASLPVLYFNWYPSQVFPGDTFCYFSGMTMAVVAILGHFSKTLLLFFIPQIINFVYSVPQLFHFVPCPRHRLPRYDEAQDKVGTSKAVFKTSELRLLGRLSLLVLQLVHLVEVKTFDKDGEEYMSCNNLTLINLVLKVMGPMHERNLTLVLLAFQCICSVVAFAIRYPLAFMFYGEIVA